MVHAPSALVAIGLTGGALFVGSFGSRWQDNWWLWVFLLGPLSGCGCYELIRRVLRGPSEP